ncbi:MAG: cytochrome c peroxidase [Burkholderiales bacterium]
MRIRPFKLWLAVVIATVALPLTVIAQGNPLGLNAEEIRLTLRHGPWPAPWTRDASNRVSAMPEAIAFGEQLFFEPRLSGTGTVSCATCHIPEKDWTDGRKLGVAMGEVDRNTPTVQNVRYHRWFGWDGANDNLWSQSVRPMLDPKEMASSERHLAQVVRSDADLSCHYRKSFGHAPKADDEALMIDIGKALAAFQETLVTGRSSFDDFRDAVMRNDWKVAASYPDNALRGARLFMGKGNCSLCHFGPNFSNGEFHEIGIPIVKKSGGIDWGRYQGIKMLRASRFSLLGAYNDDKSKATGQSTRFVDLAPQTFEQFKAPSLRNVALTAPYMHNGHFATLRDVVKHYSEIDVTLLHQAHIYAGDVMAEAVPTDTVLQPLKLSEPEISDIVAFLGSLTERKPGFKRRPAVACK